MYTKKTHLIRLYKSKKCPAFVFFQACFMLFVLKPKEILKIGTNKDNLKSPPPPRQNEFSYELTFWLILIENSGKQKRLNTLRVEINQFCDG